MHKRLTRPTLRPHVCVNVCDNACVTACVNACVNACADFRNYIHARVQRKYTLDDWGLAGEGVLDASLIFFSSFPAPDSPSGSRACSGRSDGCSGASGFTTGCCCSGTVDAAGVSFDVDASASSAKASADASLSVSGAS